jgi:hypothetical protein
MDSQRIMMRWDLGRARFGTGKLENSGPAQHGFQSPSAFLSVMKPSRSGSKLGQAQESAASTAAIPMPRLPPLNTRLEFRGP